ncbi:hypothetical protein E2C01_023176 [Portunus trituberculatus]|uniref:Uncharacterized protein n=1 Tax=Portunus trituberculatus TaxID=210409 RepID=A0A5B7EAV3_PORTR|nr:hypothetical protein [Portunus trituberculatus]
MQRILWRSAPSSHSQPIIITKIVKTFSISVVGETFPNPTDVNEEKIHNRERKNNVEQMTYPECGSPRAVAVVVLTSSIGQMVQPTYFVRQPWPLCIANSIPVKECAAQEDAARCSLIV